MTGRVGRMVPPKRDRTWFQDAACLGYPDPDAFFTFGQDPEATWSRLEAMEVCRRCSVRVACLTDALQIPDTHGLRAGTTTSDRNQARHLGIERAVEALEARFSSRLEQRRKAAARVSASR